jgi:hypothetical protein
MARALEDRYARPVTVEFPLQKWAGELRRLPAGGITESDHSIVLPDSDGIFSAPALTIDLVRKAMDEFHRQNPDRSRYKVIESKMGFHIVPTDAHDEQGTLRAVPAVLDTVVSVPVQPRTISEHLKTLVQAISDTTGLYFTPPFTDFESRYAANGYFFPYPQLRSSEDRPYLTFEWGTSGVAARDAVIDLLSRSATTMTWALMSGPNGCNLNVFFMRTGGKNLYLDHCTQCKPIPTQAGKTDLQIKAERKNGGH